MEIHGDESCDAGTPSPPGQARASARSKRRRTRTPYRTAADRGWSVVTDDDPVAAVLETTWAGEAEPMYRALTGRRPFATLTYEEWTTPVRATSGRICLRIDEPSRTRWVRWAATDEFRSRSNPAEFDRETRIEPSRLRRRLSGHPARPVLIENTPFGTATEVTDRRSRRGEPSP